MVKPYLWTLRALAALGIARACFAWSAAAFAPRKLLAVNPWGIPYWAPTVVCVALAVMAIFLLARTGVLWEALAAIWGAGAWALSTPILTGLVPVGPWWALLVIALPLAAWPVIQEVRIGVRVLGVLSAVVVVVAAVGSLATSPAAVAVAAAAVYSSAIAGPLWLTWRAYRRP